MAEQDFTFEPLPLDAAARTWIVNGLNYAGIGSTSSLTTYVRRESRDLWETLSSLTVCQDLACTGQCDTKRGVWITGPPGVGKSTELFGWGMYMATHPGPSRRNMLWMHLLEDHIYIAIVRVIDGVTYHSKFRKVSVDITHLLELAHDCSLILLDAFRADMKGFVHSFYTEFPQALIVACTSYQCREFNSEYWASMNHLQLTGCVVFSWTWEQYCEAWRAGVFGSELSLVALEELYYYAGGTIRSMFSKPHKVKEFLSHKLAALSDFGLLLKGFAGEFSPLVLNSLISISHENNIGFTSSSRLVSEYVVKAVSQKVDETFTMEARRLNVGNPSWQGWIFELEFLRNLRHMSLSSGWEHHCFLSCRGDEGTVTPIELRVQGYSEFDGTSAPPLVNDSIIVPTRWNQGCFDAVHYSVEGGVRRFLFMNATISQVHDFNFQHIADFLYLATSAAGFRQPSPADICITMAAVTPESVQFKSIGGRRDNIEAVQNFDRAFEGHVQSFFMSYNWSGLVR